jgi:hypothetical protein
MLGHILTSPINEDNNTNTTTTATTITNPESIPSVSITPSPSPSEPQLVMKLPSLSNFWMGLKPGGLFFSVSSPSIEENPAAVASCLIRIQVLQTWSITIT